LVSVHIEHNNLDLVIVSSDSIVTHNVSVLPLSPSGHFTTVDLPTISPPPPVMRHIKSINREDFNHDLASEPLITEPPTTLDGLLLNTTTPL